MSVKQVGLIIDGTRDCWIAEALAEKDIDVALWDKSGNNAASIQSHVESILDGKLAKWAITESEKKVIASHIKHVSDPQQLAKVDFLIESTGDRLAEKKELLKSLGRMCPPELVIATNTAIFRVSELAEGVAHPERVIGLHFQEDLVEMIPGELTTQLACEQTSQFVQRIGKALINVSDGYGFVTMRLILPLINDAVTMLLVGGATAEEIDQAMISGFGCKRGPLEIADRLGLDYVLQAMEQMYGLTGDDKFRPCSLLSLQVRAGHLGVKTGEGFYRYDQHGKRVSRDGKEVGQA